MLQDNNVGQIPVLFKTHKHVFGTSTSTLVALSALPSSKQDTLPAKWNTEVPGTKGGTYILATAMMPSRHVISESFNFSIALSFYSKQNSSHQ
jgi:hypothetical protein